MLKKKFRSLFKYLLHRFHPLIKRSDLPYATHIPIIVGISTIWRVRKVLELGGGNFSTYTFMDRTIFPEIEELITIEDNPEWGKYLESSLNKDNRFKLVYDIGNFAVSISELDLSKFDLIFIDNSTSSDTRSETIKIISEKNIGDAVLVIHDFEQKKYQIASNNLPYRYMFDALNPATGLIWANYNKVDYGNLKKINKIISNSNNKVDLINMVDWKNLFEAAFRK